jgi:membrane protease YdiL (CAAX protease family)
MYTCGTTWRPWPDDSRGRTVHDHHMNRTLPLSEHAAPTAVQVPQYSARGILAIWAAATLPMAALAWIVAPRLATPRVDDAEWAKALLRSLTAGLVWQFLVVVAVVSWEQRTLRWSTFRDALWLRPPRRPDGRRMGRGWWVLLPLSLAFFAESMIPSPAHPASRDLAGFLDSDVGASFFSGNWTWFAVVLVLLVFNTVLGEELLFRGVLLPRLNGAFGRFDWLVNGVLFAAYHVHTPWVMPAALLDSVILSLPSKRYRSAWIGISVHSLQSLVIAVVVLVLVLS